MKVDAGADVGILQILQSVSYTPAEAIAEYVDNAVQSYLDNKEKLNKINKNYKLEIDITCNRNEIIIKDNAAGIEDKVFQIALKTAAITKNINAQSRRNSKNSLNEFGMGMKAASYWFTNTWSIKTKSIYEKENKTVNLDLKKIIESGSGETSVKKEKENSTKGYTIITLKNLHQHIANHQKIVDRLGSIHRKFLGKDVVITYTAGKDRKFDKKKILWEQPKFRKEPPYLPYQKWINENKDNLNKASVKKIRPNDILWKVPFKFTFGVIQKDMIAEGYVAKMNEQTKAIAGFYYFRRRKLLEGPVHPETFFNNGKPDGTSTSNAIYAEVDFDGPKSVFSKNRMNIDDRDRQDFEIKLRSILREDFQKSGSDLLKQLKIPNKELDQLYDQERKLSEGKIKPEELEDYRLSQKHHGIESALKALRKNLNNTKLSKPPKKPLPPFEGKITPSELTKGIKIGNKKYTFNLEQTFEETASDPWLDVGIDEKEKVITIRIAMAHPFIQHYFLGGVREKIQQGIKLIAKYLIIAETTAREDQGVKRPEVIRDNINKILYELPPLEGKKIVS